MTTNTDAVPSLPDDLNPEIVKATAAFIGKITGLVPPPHDSFPPEWYGYLRTFTARVKEIASENTTSAMQAEAVQVVEPVDYDGVVSICDAHGIGLPVDCIEMVVEIIRHADLQPSQTAVVPDDERVAFERALFELVNKIDTGLDTGDLLKDSKRASAALDSILSGGDLVACAHDYFRDSGDRYEKSIEFRIGWNACLDAIANARAASPQPVGQTAQCWSCKKHYTEAKRSEADGNCPHCGAEIEGEPVEQIGKNALVLTGAQLLEALDFIAPDRATDAEQLESEVAIEYGEGHAGKAMYCWCAEYPEEGSWVLDGTSATVARPVEQTRALTDLVRALFRPWPKDELGPTDEPESQYRLGYNTAIEDALEAIASCNGDDAIGDAARDVLIERQRQMSVEGWTPEHDDAYACDEIAAFAAVYAMPPGARDWRVEDTGYAETFTDALLPDGWKPKFGDRRRELVKAGALILAEIERIDRATPASVIGAQPK